MNNEKMQELKQQLFDVHMEEAIALHSDDENYKKEIKDKIKNIKKQIAELKLQEYEVKRGR